MRILFPKVYRIQTVNDRQNTYLYTQYANVKLMLYIQVLTIVHTTRNLFSLFLFSTIFPKKIRIHAQFLNTYYNVNAHFVNPHNYKIQSYYYFNPKHNTYNMNIQTKKRKTKKKQQVTHNKKYLLKEERQAQLYSKLQPIFCDYELTQCSSRENVTNIHHQNKQQRAYTQNIYLYTTLNLLDCIELDQMEIMCIIIIKVIIQNMKFQLYDLTQRLTIPKE
eukprot:TRINITY_DN5748_c1_g1_i3.p2 TRINITY_DN5748_c1_g1~~TRINITY_DN5748_c1_g1_i3.p2  ORF type:complete len:220 (-),score=-12.85 TRINITY_DN5748_c1_g1_i3:121-780(-)